MDTPTSASDASASPKSKAYRAWGLALTFLILMGIGWFYLRDGLSFDNLRQNHEAIRLWVATYPYRAAVVTILIYATVAALSLPVASLLTIFIGFIFGAWLGTGLTVVGATLGATILFFVIRYIVSSFQGKKLMQEKSSSLYSERRSMWITNLQHRYQSLTGEALPAFRDQAFFYLLFLRLVPVFPFWLVNLVAALVGVKLVSFVASTFIGIIPGTMVFALVGSGLDETFMKGDNLNISTVLSPQLLVGLCGLGFLALIPPLVKIWKKRHKDSPR
ncbi:MAG: VTT domain-containing protein [Alphaproteobacteria bacterium]